MGLERGRDPGDGGIPNERPPHAPPAPEEACSVFKSDKAPATHDLRMRAKTGGTLSVQAHPDGATTDVCQPSLQKRLTAPAHQSQETASATPRRGGAVQHHHPAATWRRQSVRRTASAMALFRDPAPRSTA
eukprot:CAMPEP_0179466748 /NCGR_PEP_ID=MMETSP0799-20121207/48012_1 /TAXON_ID=46947 /ORGANISM="Geminigera cryophila, Strain CCMP2564" /LENGTH=130 /DNA_ID=CAMNT_0021271737 /DNA_START=72 /DNA_END=465 /DNA_ORIENTATION=+